MLTKKKARKEAVFEQGPLNIEVGIPAGDIHYIACVQIQHGCTGRRAEVKVCLVGVSIQTYLNITVLSQLERSSFI